MVDSRGVDAKIRRARECLESLRADITAHCAYQTQRRIREMESRARNPLLQRFHVRERDPGYVPMDFPIRVGEIAYNLRSALDHLVYALVKDNNRTPSKQTGFPILADEAGYRKYAPKMVQGIAHDRCDLIEAFQPFRGDIGRHLWMLHLICNIDKHRHLNVVDTHTSLSARFKEGVEPPRLPSRIRRGTSLYYDMQGTEHEDLVEPHVMVDVCFWNEEIVAASPGYGTATERNFQGRPPAISVLSGCLSAVTVVAEYLISAEQLPPQMLQGQLVQPKRGGLLARFRR